MPLTLFKRCKLLIARRHRRYFGTHLEKIIHVEVGQGGTSFLDLSKLTGRCELEISTGWIDHCELSLGDNIDNISLQDILRVQSDSLKQLLLISTKEDPLTQSCRLRLKVPELFNIQIQAHHIDIVQNNKLLGNFFASAKGRAELDSCSIDVDKLRGEKICITGFSGGISVRRALEGKNINLAGSAISGKLIHAKELSVTMEKDINIAAIYAANSMIHSVAVQFMLDGAGNINLGLANGNIEAFSRDGNVSIKGIDGSFNVISGSGSLNLEINSLSRRMDESIINCATSISGDVSIQLASSPNCKFQCCSQSYDSFFLDENWVEKSFDSINWSNIQPKEINGNCVMIAGSIHKKNDAAPRSSLNSGKINVSYQADILQRTNENFQSVLQVAAPHGKVVIRQASWIDSIRRKVYGPTDE